MKHPSPLRYPGGKTFLAKKFVKIFDANELLKPIYVEPYAGGAGAALALLYMDKVESIVINDFDKCIYSFWKAATEHTDEFVERIKSVQLDVDEWRGQKKIYEGKKASILDLGFATFYLNRTNVSGVMNGGPIGGLDQKGNYKIDARFNRANLADRIKKVGEFADRITVTRRDGIELTTEYLKLSNTFIYLDPPYFDKGACLYMNSYVPKDHKQLAQVLNRNAKKTWMLTYDNVSDIKELYPKRRREHLDLSYRIGPAREDREVMFRSDTLVSPRS